MKKIAFTALLTLHFISWSQNHRYTTTLFPASITISNIVYGTAPAINGPLYTVESSTSTKDLIMDIYEPAGDVFTLRPAVVFAHAGGFLLGNRTADDMKALCDTLARKGYVTASIDYRLGFNLVGNTELHSTRAVYRGLQDGRAAVRFLRANAAEYSIDPTKIYFVGSSAGSFIGLHTIYLDEASEIPAQAGTVNYTNITPPFTHTAPNLGPLDIGNYLTFNGKPDAVVSMWGAVQSTNLITANNTTPVLLIHGEADPTVDFTTGSPFGYPLLPQVDGSNPINTKLDVLGFTNKETYFVPGEGHEFYGTTNGTWDNGSGGNEYLPLITDRITQFLWKQHRPIVDYSWSATQLTVSFTDSSIGSVAWWWDFGDGTYSNEQNPTHSYANSGDYQVKLYVENNIKSWNEITKTLNVASLSTTDNRINDFYAVPNPTNGQIQINYLPKYSSIKCEVYDVVGNLVSEKQLHHNGDTISFSALSAGIYFIKITTENTIQTIKVIKQ
jgi:acetyl esterase/lipase